MAKSPPTNSGDEGSIAGRGRFRLLRGNSACEPQVKDETERAGLRLRPGCEHQATHMVTLPVDSELCARWLQKRPTNGKPDPWIEEPQDLDSPLPKKIC